MSNYLERKGFRYQQAEMGFFEQKLDLFAYSDKAKIALAVELKLRKWRSALRQALLYQLCSDHVIIAMPAGLIGAVDQDLLRVHGVGLLAVSEVRCRQILPPENSAVVRKRYRRRYINMLKGVE